LTAPIAVVTGTKNWGKVQIDSKGVIGQILGERVVTAKAEILIFPATPQPQTCSGRKHQVFSASRRLLTDCGEYEPRRGRRSKTGAEIPHTVNTDHHRVHFQHAASIGMFNAAAFLVGSQMGTPR